MDTPPAFRGENYPTHLSARCPSFHACECCLGCTNYDPHSQECVWCEARKPPNLICKHTDLIQFKKKYLEMRFRAPMFHPDQRPGVMSASIAYSKEWEKWENMEDPRGLGRISKIKEE